MKQNFSRAGAGLIVALIMVCSWFFTGAYNYYQNIVVPDGKYVQTDEVKARDGDGLKLYDDGGNGIFVQDGGNVAIGTASPGALLNISDGDADYKIYADTGFSDSDIGINSTHGGFLFDLTQGVYQQKIGFGDAGAAGNIIFGLAVSSNSGSSYTNPISVLQNGNVGIATTSPQEKLHVVGNIRNSVLAGTGNRAVYSTSDGNLTNSSSDRSLKTNIETLPYGRAETMAMLPVRFNWKDTSKRGAQNEIGFIAQDMEEIIPDVVGMNADGTKTIDYPKLTVVLCKTIQEQQAAIENLTSRIEVLEGGN